MKKVLFFSLFCLLNAADFNDIDVDLNLEDIDKPYSYKGYIKPEFYYIDNKQKYSEFKSELNFEGDYKKNLWYLKGNWSGYYQTNKYDTKYKGVINELYAKYGNVNKNILVGKELIKWGKGYAYSAVNFFARAKNPLYPEDLKEGYELIHFKTIKSLSGNIKNYSLDLIYMPADKNLNSDLEKSQNFGAKLYMLYNDIDIDFMLLKSNNLDDKYGADISFNILQELEFHSEFAINEKKESSFLAGIKYASEYDFTLTSEWYKDWSQNRFIYLKLSKKDFLVDYLTAYITGIRNYTQNLNSLLVGGSYDFKNNLILTTEYLTSTKQKQAKISFSYFF